MKLKIILIVSFFVILSSYFLNIKYKIFSLKPKVIFTKVAFEKKVNESAQGGPVSGVENHIKGAIISSDNLFTKTTSNFLESFTNKDDIKTIYIFKQKNNNDNEIEKLSLLLIKIFGKVKIVPIIFNTNISTEDTINFTNSLSKLWTEDSLVLGLTGITYGENNVISSLYDENVMAILKSSDFNNLPETEIKNQSAIIGLLSFLDSIGANKIISYEHTKNKNSSGFYVSYTNGTNNYKRDISVIGFGDAMFDRWVQKWAIPNGGTEHSFSKIRLDNNFKGIDFVWLNLEGASHTTDFVPTKSIYFNSPEAFLSSVSSAGFNLLSIANNHVFDYGKLGYNKTIENIIKYNMMFFGKYGQECFIKQISDTKIGFCAFDDTMRKLKIDELTGIINNVSVDVDYIYVSLHWGDEYKMVHNKRQEQLAHLLIDNGVDVVVGHHPHVIQDFEVYKSKPIFYSTGNFIFDQIYENTDKGVGVGVLLSEENITTCVYPYKIVKGRPEFVYKEEKQEFINNYFKYFDQSSIVEGCLKIN